MIRRKHLSVLSAALASVLLLTALSGCGISKAASQAPAPAASDAPAETAVPAEPVSPTEAAEPAGTDVPARQDGERFEAVIVMEGMEETVRYEHIRNDRIGFEMDYDYEGFERRIESDCERFVSCWDDAANPENYLELRYNPRDAETVAAAISASLSNEYEISRTDAFPLARAGSCIRIDASEAKGGGWMPEQLQMVYIIPADDGCRIAVAHYAIEASEGFGRRFHYFMESFAPIPSQRDKRLTDGQAVSAIRNYCLINYPGLEDMADSVYWDVASSGEQEIAVVFRSYTGALNRYYIDPYTGDTYVTEQVPGIIDDERRTEESLNTWDYLF